MVTVPETPNWELAVISLSADRKMPRVSIWMLPPAPLMALAMILLFSSAVIVPVLMVMLPPEAEPVASVVMELLWRRSVLPVSSRMLPLLPAAVSALRRPALSS
jgi:hypothetical protein